MRNNLFRSLILVFIASAPAYLSGQVNDAGLWTSVTVEKKITKGFDAVLTEELRMNENITEAGSFFTDIGAEYKIVRGLKAGLFYRLINKRNLDDSYTRNHRFYGDVSYKFKIRRFELGYRVRMQVQYKGYHTSETGHLPEWYIRQKFQLSYNIRKSRFDPYVGVELWYKPDPEWSRFDNLRISAGVNVRITKSQSLDIGYIVNREFNVRDPYTSYIIFSGYRITF